MSRGSKQPNRTLVLIDGFNLYFGLKASRMERFYWLDIAALARRLVRDRGELIGVKYFTSRVSGPADKAKRQRDYLDALAHTSRIEFIYGKYSYKDRLCPACQRRISTPEEKMTDVSIATHLLVAALENRFETAILVTADSDLVPPIKAIHQSFPGKRVVAAFPPGRRSNELKCIADAAFVIGKSHFSACQLPDAIDCGGHVIQRPASWR